MVYVLSGEVTLLEDDSAVPLCAGKAAAWPAGGGVHHALEIRTDKDATYLVIGTRATQDRVTFRDHDLVLQLHRDKDGTIDRKPQTKGGETLG